MEEEKDKKFLNDIFYADFEKIEKQEKLEIPFNRNLHTFGIAPGF
jgi:hypothetical protein